MSHLVVVTVGTDYHPFNRLISSMDRWAKARQVPQVRCLVQYGSSDSPGECEGEPFLSQDKLRDALQAADVVVCHGGPATIAEARAAGIRPICMPRDPMRGEHVDDHQIRFARRVARDGVVILAEDEAELHLALDRALIDPDSVSMSSAGTPDASRRAAVDQVGGLIEGLLTRGSRVRRAR